MRRKSYGQYRVDACPFCGSQGSVKNKQGIPVCMKHKEMVLEDLKCSCGSWLDLKIGKYGPYFFCFECGNVNYKKGLDMNSYPLMSIEDL